MEKWPKLLKFDTAKFYFTCISSPGYLIKLYSMKKIHPAIVEECVRMDIWTQETDRTRYMYQQP